jgi:hypothetical protein
MQSSRRERVNVIFPGDVLKELRELVPVKHRSELVVQATKEKLALLRQQQAVRNAAGSWKDEDHPELQTEEDLTRWLGEIRGSWQARQKLLNLKVEDRDVSS